MGNNNSFNEDEEIDKASKEEKEEYKKFKESEYNDAKILFFIKIINSKLTDKSVVLTKNKVDNIIEKLESFKQTLSSKLVILSPLYKNYIDSIIIMYGNVNEKIEANYENKTEPRCDNFDKKYLKTKQHGGKYNFKRLKNLTKL